MTLHATQWRQRPFKVVNVGQGLGLLPPVWPMVRLLPALAQCILFAFLLLLRSRPITRLWLSPHPFPLKSSSGVPMTVHQVCASLLPRLTSAPRVLSVHGQPYLSLWMMKGCRPWASRRPAPRNLFLIGLGQNEWSLRVSTVLGTTDAC